MNMDMHIPNKAENGTISKIGRFSRLDKYSHFIDKENELIKKYANIPMLNDQSFNDVRYILVSGLYQSDIKRNFSITHSIGVFAVGWMIFLDSPAEYPHLENIGVKSFQLDIFDLPNVELSEPYLLGIFVPGSKICFSLYQVLYPIVLFSMIFNLKRNGFIINYVLVYVVIFSTLYTILDVSEANRMRFEIEPMFLFLTICSFTRIFKTLNSLAS
jgi:hypothetical protein